MNIAMIAHDAKKKLMQNFCIAYRGILCKHTMYATGTTGRLIEEVTNLTVHKYLARTTQEVQWEELSEDRERELEPCLRPT